MSGSFDKPDGNRQAIVDVLRQAGATVDLLPGGNGRPDLLIGHGGRNLLAEVKMPKGKLKPAQERWHQAWRGSVAVIRSPEDAIALLQAGGI